MKRVEDDPIEVILNRVDSRTFPNSVCGVVHQRGQFTYNKNARIREKGTFARVQKVAIAALSGAPDAQDGRFRVPQILGEEA